MSIIHCFNLFFLFLNNNEKIIKILNLLKNTQFEDENHPLLINNF